ncbi:MAG: hypothetical protein QXX03_05545 [Nitrososphaerota archaeon]
MEITVKVKTDKGEMAYTSSDRDAIISFINWIFSSKKETKTAQPTTPTQTTQTPTTQQRTQRRRQVTESEYTRLVETINNVEKIYGTDALNKFLQDNDITINEQMSNAQMRRVYALLRRTFPDAFKKTPTAKTPEPEPEF